MNIPCTLSLFSSFFIPFSASVSYLPSPLFSLLVLFLCLSLPPTLSPFSLLSLSVLNSRWRWHCKRSQGQRSLNLLVLFYFYLTICLFLFDSSILLNIYPYSSDGPSQSSSPPPTTTTQRLHYYLLLPPLISSSSSWYYFFFHFLSFLSFYCCHCSCSFFFSSISSCSSFAIHPLIPHLLLFISSLFLLENLLFLHIFSYSSFSYSQVLLLHFSFSPFLLFHFHFHLTSKLSAKIEKNIFK